MDFVGNSEIQGTLPLPGSSTRFHHLYFLSLSLSLFWFWSTFPWIEKKITQLPSTRHMVLCRFFFFLFFFGRSPPHVSLFSTPRFGPLCTMGPAQRPATFVFFSLSLSALPPMEVCTNFTPEGMVDGR